MRGLVDGPRFVRDTMRLALCQSRTPSRKLSRGVSGCPCTYSYNDYPVCDRHTKEELSLPAGLRNTPVPHIYTRLNAKYIPGTWYIRCDTLGEPDCTPGVQIKRCTPFQQALVSVVFFAFFCGRLVEALDFGGLGRGGILIRSPRCCSGLSSCLRPGYT